MYNIHTVFGLVRFLASLSHVCRWLYVLRLERAHEHHHAMHFFVLSDRVMSKTSSAPAAPR